MASCSQATTQGGFELIRLQNDCLSVSVLPQLGGKILELTDLRSGRDWLWKNPHLALRKPEAGLDYEKELDSGGWDEVLFSVKPCSIDLTGDRNLSVGDHGPLVSMPWKVVESFTSDAGAAVLELSAQGHEPAFEFRRRISLDPNEPKLDIEYSLYNRDEVPWPWMWCAHPLIAIEQGMQISIGDGQSMHWPEAARPVNGNQYWPWLNGTDGEQLNLARIFENPGDPESMCAKVFVRAGKWIGVNTRARNEGIRIEYDEQELPWLGLWINKRGWSGCGSEPYLNLGLEPATAPFDFLTDAVSDGSAEILEPGASKNWSLSVYLEHADT